MGLAWPKTLRARQWPRANGRRAGWSWLIVILARSPGARGLAGLRRERQLIDSPDGPALRGERRPQPACAVPVQVQFATPVRTINRRDYRPAPITRVVHLLPPAGEAVGVAPVRLQLAVSSLAADLMSRHHVIQMICAGCLSGAARCGNRSLLPPPEERQGSDARTAPRGRGRIVPARPAPVPAGRR